MCRGGVFRVERKREYKRKQAVEKGRKIRSTVGQVASILHSDPLDTDSVLFLLSPVDIFYQCCEHNLSPIPFSCYYKRGDLYQDIVSRLWPYLGYILFTGGRMRSFFLFLQIREAIFLGLIAAFTVDETRNYWLHGITWCLC